MLLAVVMLIDICTVGGNMPVGVTKGSVETTTSVSRVGTGVGVGKTMGGGLITRDRVGELVFWPHTQKSFRGKHSSSLSPLKSVRQDSQIIVSTLSVYTDSQVRKFRHMQK